jgi:4-hydroxybenzoate polyprenyltransferase
MAPMSDAVSHPAAAPKEEPPPPAWFELLRVPAALATMSEPLAGAIIAGAGWGRTHHVLLLMLASVCLYAGGVALNDAHDFARDRHIHPRRPLTSGRIRRITGLFAGLGLLIVGGALGSVPGPATSRVAWLLFSTILLYDLVLKEIPVAPALRATCRALNMLMGMTLVPVEESLVGWDIRSAALAVVGLYALGLALFDRRVHEGQRGQDFIAGVLATWSGIAAAALLSFVLPGAGLDGTAILWLCVVMLATGYRTIQTLLTPRPDVACPAARTALFSLVLIDAALATYVRGMPAGALVAIPLLPALWLDRWIGHPCPTARPEPGETAEASERT